MTKQSMITGIQLNTTTNQWSKSSPQSREQSAVQCSVICTGLHQFGNLPAEGKWWKWRPYVFRIYSPPGPNLYHAVWQWWTPLEIGVPHFFPLSIFNSSKKKKKGENDNERRLKSWKRHIGKIDPIEGRSGGYNYMLDVWYRLTSRPRGYFSYTTKLSRHEPFFMQWPKDGTVSMPATSFIQISALAMSFKFLL